MKIQKKVTVSIVIGTLLSLILFVGSASAAYKCSNATIGEIGKRPSISPNNETSTDYEVWLRCQGWATERRFFLAANLGDSGYATILTAKSLGKNVSAWMEEPIWNALITEIAIVP